MACNFNIKVVEQNDFTICIPLKKRTFVASTPIDEDVDILALEDLSVKIGGAVFPATRDAAGVMVDVSRDALARGTYDVVLTATYKGHAIKAAYFDSLTIVEWNCQSDAQQCVQGSPIMFEAGFVIYNLTDAELAALKEEYRLKIAAAEEAKEEADAAKDEYIAKAEALDDMAKQTTLVQGVSDIREDIRHIDIDTSNLAKQGSNAGATLTDTQAAAVQAASDAASAKTAAQQAQQAAASSAQETTAQSILAKVQSIINSHIANGISYDGWVYQNGYSPISFGDAIGHFSNLTLVYDPTITEITQPYFCAFAQALTSISLPNVTKIVDRFCEGCSSLLSVSMPSLEEIQVAAGGILASTQVRELSLPSLRTITQNTFRIAGTLEKIIIPNIRECTGVYNFWQMSNLKVLNMHNLFSSSNMQQWQGCFNLIDLELGANFTANVNINTWSPTNALNASSSSLVDSGETFANNLEKLLYNIREHIAANLPDRTGLSSLTITFSAAIKAAIQADTATSNAFTNKNWTIA